MRSRVKIAMSHAVSTLPNLMFSFLDVLGFLYVSHTASTLIQICNSNS
jgi:hypothetical protein